MSGAMLANVAGGRGLTMPDANPLQWLNDILHAYNRLAPRKHRNHFTPTNVSAWILIGTFADQTRAATSGAHAAQTENRCWQARAANAWWQTMKNSCGDTSAQMVLQKWPGALRFNNVAAPNGPSRWCGLAVGGRSNNSQSMLKVLHRHRVFDHRYWLAGASQVKTIAEGLSTPQGMVRAQDGSTGNTLIENGRRIGLPLCKALNGPRLGRFNRMPRGLNKLPKHMVPPFL